MVKCVNIIEISLLLVIFFFFLSNSFKILPKRKLSDEKPLARLIRSWDADGTWTVRGARSLKTHHFKPPEILGPTMYSNLPEVLNFLSKLWISQQSSYLKSVLISVSASPRCGYLKFLFKTDIIYDIDGILYIYLFCNTCGMRKVLQSFQKKSLKKMKVYNLLRALNRLQKCVGLLSSCNVRNYTNQMYAEIISIISSPHSTF